MEILYFAGLDIHKKTIAIMVKDQKGKVIQKKTIKSRRDTIKEWAETVPKPFAVAMEAGLFSGWIYDEMKKYTEHVKVAHSVMLKYISSSKKKDDQIDAEKLSDLLRVNLIPEVFMLPRDVRYLRELLRYRNWIVRENTRFKNKITGQLMMNGIIYPAAKIHNKGFFHDFIDNLEFNEEIKTILKMSRNQLEILSDIERKVKKILLLHSELVKRINMLRTIPGVGEITALSWILEVWDPNRFSNYKKAISYCGLCSALHKSGDTEARGPLSKQRNRKIQWVLIEASKIGVHRLKVPELVKIYDAIKDKKNRNAATIGVARQLVKWLMAVDKRQEAFVIK